VKIDNKGVKKQEEEGDYGIAFGYKRGACQQCNCSCYKFGDKGKCSNCEHFATKHKNLGRVSNRQERSYSLNDNELNLNHIRIQSARPELMKKNKDEEIDKKFSDKNFNIEIETELDPDWLLNYEDITLQSKIGKGKTSSVFKGLYKNLPVAIKIFDLIYEKQIVDFKNEISIITKVRSDYIVHCFVSCVEPKICVVMELCDSSLWHHLRSNNEIKWDHFFQWCLDFTRGLNIFHYWSPQIVHRDLKTLNLLLVDNNMHLKIGDFGLSRFVNVMDHDTLSKLRGTYAYTAPELYYHQNYTTKSDIYSVGIIIWEIVFRIITKTHQNPFDEFTYIKYPIQIVHQAALKNLRPTLPENVPEPIANIIKQCWQDSPENRPNCPQLIEKLNLCQLEYVRNKTSNVWSLI